MEHIVYVVDDDPAVLDSVSLLIRSAGLKVMAFPSALEFLAAFIPNQIACLVLDIRMPSTTGLELQAELERLQPAAAPNYEPDHPDHEWLRLRELGRGLSSKEIASALGISVKTVETHRARMMETLGCRRANELLLLAARHLAELE